MRVSCMGAALILAGCANVPYEPMPVKADVAAIIGVPASETEQYGSPDSGVTAVDSRHVVKLTFSKGASLKDPARLFNSSLEGNVRRAIDVHEGEGVDESAFKALVRQAVALNSSGKSKPSKKAKS
jgi:hypothetical protein